MLLQNTLDLSTFEIVRFRIWNQTSQPSDRGFGSKYFNTNSGHEAYCREEIFTPIGWRTAAYMDDIEALTNGEGSLGTRVKALEDMLKVDDANDVINTWAEIQEFLDQVQEGTDLMTMLDDKLSKSQGGTVKGVVTFLGRLKNYGITEFHSSVKETYAYLANNAHARNDADGKNLAIFNGTRWNDIIHEGNVGDYALKVDGSNEMEAPLKLFSGDISTVNYHGLFVGTANISDGAAFNYGAFISIPDRGTSQLQLSWYRSYHSPQLAIRLHESNNWGDWKSVAFTDSTVAAANRLANKVSLWGNEFDGTQDISGFLRINNNSSIFFRNAENTENVSAIILSNNNRLAFGVGARMHGYITQVFGKAIDFYTGSSGVSMTITEEGNIEVAGANNIYTRKLAVGVGGAHIIATTTGLPSLGTPEAGTLLVGSAQYGLQIGTNTNDGASFIQAMRFDSATAYALNLNPLGGAVNVGGNLAPNANNSLFLGTSSYRWSNVYSVGGDFSGNIRIANDFGLLSTTSSGSVIQLIGITKSNNFNIGTNVCHVENLPTNIHGSNIRFYTGASLAARVNPMTLTPEGRVLIGGAADDGTSALQVKGLATFNGGALIPTGQTLTIGSVTIKEVATGEIEVNGNLHATGTLASGGKAEEGENTTGNAMVYQYDLASGESVYTVDNVKGSTNVIVQIFEWNGNTSSWDMILTDVSVKADAITVTFGRTTTVNHMVTVC